MPLEVGTRIAHYDVTALIGQGGMGQVYQATDTKLNRDVALKILPEAFASDPEPGLVPTRSQRPRLAEPSGRPSGRNSENVTD